MFLDDYVIKLNTLTRYGEMAIPLNIMQCKKLGECWKREYFSSMASYLGEHESVLSQIKTYLPWLLFIKLKEKK